MTGPNIEHLRRTTQGMRSDHVSTAQFAWAQGATSLKTVMDALAELSPTTIAAFGDGATGEGARSALQKIHDNLGTRHRQMNDAATALRSVVAAMQQAEDKAANIPSAPGPAPTRPSPLGNDGSDVEQMKAYHTQKSAYDGQVASYASFDSGAAAKVRAVNDSYDQASTVLAGIHGDPQDPASAGTTGSGGGYPATSQPATTHHHGVITRAGGTGGGWSGGGGTATGVGGTSPGGAAATGGGAGTGPYGDPGLPGAEPSLDPHGSGPGDGGGLLSPMTAAGGGAVGAGVLGGFGLRGILAGRGSLSVPGETGANAIGSSSRGANGSVLGRGDAAGAEAESGSGARGTGTAGGAGGRRGKDDERGPNGEDYDVDEDWTEDDGQFPGVIS